MISTRIFSFVFVLGFLGLVAGIPFVAADQALARRESAADVESIVNSLKSSTDSILPQLNNLVSSKSASDSSVSPLINELTAALNTATKSLSTAERRSLGKRQSDEDIAVIVAGIVSDVTTTLNGLLLVGAEIPLLGSLLVGVDLALNEVLLGLEVTLAGVLQLVAGLLVGVAGLLGGLGLGLVLATLGL